VSDTILIGEDGWQSLRSNRLFCQSEEFVPEDLKSPASNRFGKTELSHCLGQRSHLKRIDEIFSEELPIRSERWSNRHEHISTAASSLALNYRKHQILGNHGSLGVKSHTRTISSPEVNSPAGAPDSCRHRSAPQKVRTRQTPSPPPSLTNIHSKGWSSEKRAADSCLTAMSSEMSPPSVHCK